MTKITELTPEQEQLMGVVSKEWIEKLTKQTIKFDKEAAINGINFIYELSGYKHPEIHFVESPMACQKLAQEMNGTKEFYQFSSYGNIGDYGWVAFYDFFDRIGVEVTENYKKFRSLINSGIYDMLQFEHVCIVSMMPVKVSVNEDGRLHNASSFAIEWSDGYGQYYINGRNMPEKIFQGFTKMDFINETNEDIKAGMYEIIESKGEGSMLEFLGAVMVDEKSFVHANGYIETMQLYKTTEFFNEEEDLTGRSPAPLAWLKMSCPSTNQVYLIPSDGSFDDCETAAKYHRPDNIPSDVDYIWHSRN